MLSAAFGHLPGLPLACCLWFPLYLRYKDKCIHAIHSHCKPIMSRVKKDCNTHFLISHCHSHLTAPYQLLSAKVAFRSALPLAGIQCSAEEQQRFPWSSTKSPWGEWLHDWDRMFSLPLCCSQVSQEFVIESLIRLCLLVYVMAKNSSVLRIVN